MRKNGYVVEIVEDHLHRFIDITGDDTFRYRNEKKKKKNELDHKRQEVFSTSLSISDYPLHLIYDLALYALGKSIR